ncbi:MAG: fructose-bisphosphatase class III, partial [Clostridia bacterium]
SMYLCYNGNLLFHGSIPLDENGEFLNVSFYGKTYKGKAYLDYCDEIIRRAYKLKQPADLAFIWQLWCGNKSPIFGKDKMATFERLYVADKETHKETKQPYFFFQDNVIVCNNILREFGLDTKNGRIINGHIPVKHADGESPIKAKGKMIVIDGGMSKPYQRVTGIAGYTLTYHSFGMAIASHAPFLGKEEIVKNNAEVLTEKYVVNRSPVRIKVAETDIGKALQMQIEDLKELLERYRSGKLSR